MENGVPTFSVDDALQAVGFGKYQGLLLAYAGMGWVAEAMEMMLLSFVGPAVHSEWGLSPHQESLITSVVFVGMMVGACSWGILSDSKGRRQIPSPKLLVKFHFSPGKFEFHEFIAGFGKNVEGEDLQRTLFCFNMGQHVFLELRLATYPSAQCNLNLLYFESPLGITLLVPKCSHGRSSCGLDGAHVLHWIKSLLEESALELTK
eukprot:Gb_23365 [translate_table: standard]